MKARLKPSVLILLVSNAILFTLLVTYSLNNNGDAEGFVSSDSDVKKLLKLLCHLDVFLVDVEKLQDVIAFKNSTHLELNFQNYIDTTNSLPGSYAYTAFGIKVNHLGAFSEKFIKFSKRIGFTCVFDSRSSSNPADNQKSIVTLVTVKCNEKYLLAVNVFYDRTEYFWIGAEAHAMPHIKWFNDVPRAMQRFEVVTVFDSFMNELKIPDNLNRFFFDYDHSKFLECNREVAEFNRVKSGGNYSQDLKKNEKLKPCFREMTSRLDKLYKHYFLSSGTLLGWYRDCGVIPHTTDQDFAIYSNEYEDKIRDGFIGNPLLFLFMSLGRRRNSFELRNYGCGAGFDLFLVYKSNNNRECSYYHTPAKVYPQCFPEIKEFCSADLLGFKVTVPCNSEEILQLHYGAGWKDPNPVKYKLASMLWGEGRKRNVYDLPYMYRYYSSQGVFLLEKTLQKINEEYFPLTGKNLTKLPPDEREYM